MLTPLPVEIMPVDVQVEIMPVDVQSETSISCTIPGPGIAGSYILRVFNDYESDEAFIGFIAGCTCDINRDMEITPQDALCAFRTYLGICPTALWPL